MTLAELGLHVLCPVGADTERLLEYAHQMGLEGVQAIIDGF